MKKLNPWIVLTCLLWTVSVSPATASPLLHVELPGYEALLAREAPLNSRSRFLHNWLKGNRTISPDWVQAHPDLADALFEELLSDAVMARAAQEQGLLAEPDSYLAALAKGHTGRRGQLYGRYLQWRTGSYHWDIHSEDRLEQALAEGMVEIDTEWNMMLRQLPRRDQGHVIHLITSVSLSLELEPQPFAAPELLQRWQEYLAWQTPPKTDLHQLFAGLRFARDLPYPALEIRLLDLLEDVLAEAGQDAQGRQALQRAHTLAQNAGFTGLAAEIELEQSLYETSLLPALETFRIRIEATEDPKIRAGLALRLALYLLYQRQFEDASRVLKPLTQDLAAPLADKALEIGLASALPFAWEQAIESLASHPPTEQRVALQALQALPEAEETEQDTTRRSDRRQQKAAAQRAHFYARLGPLLSQKLHDPDPEIQRLALVLMTKSRPELPHPHVSTLMEMLKREDPALRTAVLQKLMLQQEELSRETRQQLLPYLPTSTGWDTYCLLEMLTPLQGPEVVEALDTFLQKRPNQDGLWASVWHDLQTEDPLRANQRLDLLCEAPDPEALLPCLESWLKRDESAMPAKLQQFLTLKPWRPGDFYRVGYNVPTAHFTRLLGLLRQPNPRVVQGTLAILKTIQLSQSLNPAHTQALQTALAPLLQHPTPQIRLQASEVYLLPENALSRSLLKRLLSSGQAADFLLAFQNLQMWASTPGEIANQSLLKDLLNGLQQPDHTLAESLLWTSVRSPHWEQGQPLTLHNGISYVLSHNSYKAPQLAETDLWQLLKVSEPSIQVWAIAQMRWKHTAQHLQVLQNLLANTHAEVRLTAYQHLLNLRQSLPGHYLEALKNPADLPVDTDAHLRLILADTEASKALMQFTEYAHLRTRSSYRTLLWERLPQETDPERVFLLVSQLSQGDVRPATEQIMPLLAKDQTPVTRAAGLRLLLNQVPALANTDSVLSTLANESDPVLQLGLLQHWLSKGDYRRTRRLLKKLSASAAGQPDPDRLGLVWGLFPEELPPARTVEERVQWLLSEDQGVFASEQSRWTDWLSWSMNRDLPPSWRREIFKQALAALQTSQRAR